MGDLEGLAKAKTKVAGLGVLLEDVLEAFAVAPRFVRLSLEDFEPLAVKRQPAAGRKKR